MNEKVIRQWELDRDELLAAEKRENRPDDDPDFAARLEAGFDLLDEEDDDDE